MTTHDELIARIEAATGADREIDRAIMELFGLKPDYAADWGARGHDRPAPYPYTASIDAALTLAPDAPNQWYLAIDQWPSRTMAEVRERPGDWAYSVDQYRATLTESGGGFRQTTSVCNSIALALCAASLKARNA